MQARITLKKTLLCFSKAQKVLGGTSIHMVQLPKVFRYGIFTFPMPGWIEFPRIFSLWVTVLVKIFSLAKAVDHFLN